MAELHPAMAMRFDSSDMKQLRRKDLQYFACGRFYSIRSLLIDLLNKEGRFTVTQKVNGQEAWDYLKVLRNRCEGEPHFRLCARYYYRHQVARHGRPCLCKLVKKTEYCKSCL